MKNSNKKGFTLVELVVVIAIIGVLAAILVPSMMGYVKKSRLKTANGNAKTAYNAAAEAVADLETQGIQFAGGAVATQADVDCTATPGDFSIPTDASGAQAYLENCLKKNLGPNGADGGFATIKSKEASTTNPVFEAYWHKTTSDTIVGRYPEAPADVAAAEALFSSYK